MATRQRKPQGKRRPKKIIKYRRPLQLNIGMVVFGIIFLYMLVCIYAHFTSTHISPYEVREGSIVVDNTCRGLILRDEEIVYSNDSGYISYYVRAGQKVSGSSNVYSLDGTGQVIDTLTEAYAQNGILDSESLQRLRTSMEAYGSDITPTEFNKVYDFRDRMEVSVISMVNEVLLEQANAAGEGAQGNFNFVKAAKPGIIQYYTDGFETITLENFNEELMDSDKYEKRDLSGASIVNAGDPVYKLVTDERWKIVIALDEEKLSLLSDKSSIEIRFSKNELETKADFEIMRRGDKAYGVLSLSNYMVDFAEDRYVDIELVLSEATGLKIPVSALTEKQFYTIPVDFETTGEDNNTDGYLREVYLPDGTASVEFVATTIYETTDEYCYVDCDDFKPGDYIIRPNSTDRYQIGTTASLKGVYNINRGYAIFRKVNVLYQTEEYCIVESESNYGLAIYDHIVLDSKSVTEEEIIVN